MKYRIYFDNHAPLVYTIDEIIRGDLFMFCQVQNQKILSFALYSGRTLKNGDDVFIGDAVLANGTKRKGDYKTVVIESKYIGQLQDNNTYFTDNASLLTIKEVIK